MYLINRLIVSMLALALVACEDSSSAQARADAPTMVQQEESVSDAAQEVASPALSESERLEKSLADVEAQMGVKVFVDPWTGDLDVMTRRRLIRVLTVYAPGRYYLDESREKGIAYEWLKMFENFVNEKFEKKHLQVHVVFIPVARDQLIPGLISGRGDIAVAGLTITDEREKLVDFSKPISHELSELLVTGPSAPPIDAIEDLAGRSIFVRASSSYRASIEALNQRFLQQGLDAIEIEDAPELLEDGRAAFQ